MPSNPEPELPELLTGREVAERLKLTPQRVWQLAKSGRLPSCRIGDRGDYRFRHEDVERLLTRAKPS